MRDINVKSLEAAARAGREAIRPYQRQAPGPDAALSALEWEEMQEVYQRPFRMILTAFSAEFGIRPWYGYMTPDGWAHVWRPWLWIRCDASEIARRLAGGDE